MEDSYDYIYIFHMIHNLRSCFFNIWKNMLMNVDFFQNKQDLNKHLIVQKCYYHKAPNQKIKKNTLCVIIIRITN